MQYFFKPLYFAFFAILVSALSLHAGPRPDYQTSSNDTLLKRSASFMLLGSYPGNFTAPSPGGAASLRNYTTAMPAARIDSSYPSNKPYPTNKWYTSLFVNPSANTTDANASVGNRFSPSPMTVVFDTRFPYYWPEDGGTGLGLGYSIGGQIIASPNQNETYVTNALAFSVHGVPASVPASDISDISVIHATNIKMKDYSDWSVTSVLEDSTNSANTMTTTFGKGFAFVYNSFSPNVNPRLKVKFVRNDGNVIWYRDNNGTLTNIGSNVSITTDHIMMRVKINIADNIAYGMKGVDSYQYFGIYAPPGTTFTISAYNWDAWQHAHVCNITFSSSNPAERYLAIALLKSPSAADDDAGAFTLFQQYYNYAYNFVTNTQVSWTYNSDATLTTDFNFSFDVKRAGGTFIPNQTVFAMYPHQWKNMVGTPNLTNTYDSIRGLLKSNAGNSFQTKHKFNGIMPFLTYELPDGTATAKLQSYIDYDKTFEPAQARIDGAWKGNSNTYYHGKAVARAANLLSVFHQHGDFAARDAMINKLKTELSTWYSGQNSSKYFGYDSSWGGIVGSNPGGGAVSDFGASQYNDHHFHYGYFIYASALLAIYDPEFASSSKYKGIVDLLVREIANPGRTGTYADKFPFLRNFDAYEGHSYANGRGGGDFWFGNDEESTSEAMNAWAGIYLWGLATKNQEWMNLAVYGYTTQYEATKNYYYNIDGDIWSRSNFNHASVGMLYESSFKWSLWWDPKITQTVMGIQVLPLTPSNLYMGYDTNYARNFYNEMWSGRDTSKSNLWRDIWLKYEALFDAPQALSDWESANLPANFPDTFNTGLGDDGSNMSSSYHFIHFFNSLGTVDTGYYASEPSFLVMNKNGNRTFIAYNPDKSNYKTVSFYKRPAASGPTVPNGGVMTIPPGAMAQTQDFASFTYSKTDTSYSADTSSNTQRDVYSIYSDNFLGAVVGGNAYNDKLSQDSWETSVNFTSHSSFSDSYEGNNYLSAVRTLADWGGWGFKFPNGALDMSSFANGSIEVSIKLDAASTVAGNFEIGFETAAGQAWFTLQSLGFNQSSTDWQKISIPLSSQYVPAANLGFVTLPFIMRHNAGSSQSEWGVPVYVDSILWKKANISVYCYLELKSRADSQPASKIGWTIDDFMRKNAVAQQYIEIGLNNTEGNSWGMQIYTDNKSSMTVTDIGYSGTVDSNTVAGLVNIDNKSAAMIPMMWRVAPEIFDLSVSSQTLVNTEDPYGMMVWGAVRDVSAFSSYPGSGLSNGSDELIIWDKQGFKWDQWGMQRGVPPDDKKVRVYFLADFSKGTRALYKANIVIEYFNE